MQTQFMYVKWQTRIYLTYADSIYACSMTDTCVVAAHGILPFAHLPYYLKTWADHEGSLGIRNDYLLYYLVN